MSESETREMDDIVEKFLEKKLADEIKEARRAMGVVGLKTIGTELKSILDDCEELSNKVTEKKGTGRDKLYNLLNVITEWHDLSTKTNSPAACCSLVTLSKYVKQLKKELEDEKAVKQPKKDPKDEQAVKQPKKDEPAALPMRKPEIYRWSCHAESLATIYGFDDRIEIMERLLLRPTPKPIGIVGEAGVGKTAFCQKAYNHPSVRDHFPLRLWLCMSKNQQGASEHKDYFKMMMSCLGYEDQVIQKISEAKQLQLALQRHLDRGRYLVVLDDVWIDKDKDKFVMDEDVRKVFGFLNRKLGTLVVTSRSPELEEMLGADNIDVHKLLPLPKLSPDHDSCFKIFIDAWKKESTELTNELSNDEKKGIVEKCAGLPLMAKMLGEIGPPPPPPEESSKLNEESTTNNQ